MSTKRMLLVIFLAQTAGEVMIDIGLGRKTTTDFSMTQRTSSLTSDRTQQKHRVRAPSKLRFDRKPIRIAVSL